MKKHVFFVLISLVSTLVITSCKNNEQKEDTSPNFVFIVIDDQNMDLACFGQDHVITPNIDKLASQGVRFKHAYVQQAVCAASRASFLTGLHPASTGVEYPYSYYFVEEVIPKYGTIGQHFLNNGYFTRYFGKIHHGYSEKLSAPNFSPGGTRYLDPENIRLDTEYGNDSVPPYECFEGPDSLFKDGKTANAVVQALKDATKQDQPFFFAVGFLKPHLPFSAPKKYWDLYERENISLVENKYRPEGSPDIAISRYNLAQYHWEHADPDRLFSDDYARLLRHAYFACTSFVDAQIGKIADQLEELGLSENTYIVYVSDHGFHMGEQNHFGKTSLHEANLNSPMIFSRKGMENSGSESAALVEYVDVLPSLMDLAGLEIPSHVEGISVRQLLDNPDLPFKKAVFSQQERESIGRKKGFSMRNDQYRYTEWRNTVTGEVLALELYDLVNDPLETKNIGLLAENDDLVQALSRQLKDGWKKALPEGVAEIPDNPPAPPAYSHGREGIPRRALWHQVYGGSEEEGWKKAVELRLKKEDEIRKAL